MELRVLGSVTVVGGDGTVHVLGVTREAALLADLVVHAGEVMSASRLIDDLWRGAPTAGAGATLQTYVKNVRRLLERASAGATACVIRTVRPGYVAEIHPDAVDAFRAERMIAEGRRAACGGDAAEAVRHLSAAIALWRGPSFGDLGREAYVEAEAARLDELRLVAVEALIDAELALGRHMEAVGRLEILVGEHPYRERLWAQLMLALSRSGRQAEALRAYQRVHRLLGDDMGLEPGDDLRDLEQAILLRKPSPGPDPAADGGLPLSGPSRRRGGAQGRRSDLPSPLTRFVGRTAERRDIAQCLTASRLVTLVGMGGVGKTRLALEVAADVQGDYADGVWLFELRRRGARAPSSPPWREHSG
jgi:DNA-binding SARP family transcriptional activator